MRSVRGETLVSALLSANYSLETPLFLAAALGVSLAIAFAKALVVALRFLIPFALSLALAFAEPGEKIGTLPMLLLKVASGAGAKAGSGGRGTFGQWW